MIVAPWPRRRRALSPRRPTPPQLCACGEISPSLSLSGFANPDRVARGLEGLEGLAFCGSQRFGGGAKLEHISSSVKLQALGHKCKQA